MHHRHNLSHEFLNSFVFRASWSLVVGCTTAAGGMLGLIANSIWRQNAPDCVHILPDSFWLSWSLVLGTLVIAGDFSCMRPACDLFIAGATQTFPTFYLQLVLCFCRKEVASLSVRLLQLGLFGNAPLIFVYPWMVQHSGLSLGSINAMLHTVLGLSWSAQALGLTHVCCRTTRTAAEPLFDKRA